jgi:hypothetical protein
MPVAASVMTDGVPAVEVVAAAFAVVLADAVALGLDGLLLVHAAAPRATTTAATTAVHTPSDFKFMGSCQ